MKVKQLLLRLAVWTTAVCTMAGLSGCYNDKDILARLKDQKERLEALDRVCLRANTNIASLQTIVGALQKNDYISSITPILEGGKTIGYTLTFVHSGTVTLYHGQDGADGQDGKNGADGRNGADGQDGATPIVGVQQDTDGIWYWTLNGEWLLDKQGNKIRAVGTDGEDGANGQDGKDGSNGQDGVTPQLKIEDGAWYYSLDGGKTWSYIGPAIGNNGLDGQDGTDGQNGANGKNGANGENGDPMFKSVTQDSQYVYITLSDNTVFTIPKECPLEISFWADKGYINDTLVMPKMYDYLDLNYKVTSPTSEVAVQVVTSADVDAYVIPDGQKPLEGVIRIRTTESIQVDSGTGQLLSKILVLVTNPTSAIMRSLAIQESKLIRQDGDHIVIYHQGGKLDLHYQTNSPVIVTIPDSSSTWCWQVQTKAQLADSVVSIHIEPNLGVKLRRAVVTVSTLFGVGNPGSITFTIDQDYNYEPIVFADSGLKQYLIDNPKVNINRDGEISKAEAAMVTSLYTLFGTGVTEGRSYLRFNEFQYFTGITEIPDGAFNKWTSLDSIKIPESINTIKTGANGSKGIFQNCTKLKSIQGKYTKDNTIVYNKQLLRVAPAVVYDGQFIPDGVEIIGCKALSQLSTTDLYIPSSVKTIRDHACEYASFTKVRFAMTTDDPSTGKAYVDSLSETAFSHCFQIERFLGPTSNGSVRVTPDKLGLYEGNTFLAYALGADATSFAIPESLGIQKLATCVFDLTDGSGDPVSVSLKNLGVPTTLSQVRTHAFRNAVNLIVWFKGGTVPTLVEGGAFSEATGFGVAVPAVMDGETINKAVTQTRVAEFKAVLDFKEVSFYDPSQWYTVFKE